MINARSNITAVLEIIVEDWRINSRSGLLTKMFLANYRIGRKLFLLKKNGGIFYYIAYFPFYIIYKVLCQMLGCSVPFSAKIGRQVCFVHGLSGVFISGFAEIGDRCTILHQVTIGSNIGSKKANIGAPILEENVFVGAGAKIIGDIRVEFDVLIGAQALVVTNVSSGSKCYAPASIIIPSSQ